MANVFVDVSRKITLGFKDPEGIARTFELTEKKVNVVPDEIWAAASKVKSSNGKSVLDNLEGAGQLQRLTPEQAEAIQAGAAPFLAERRIIPPAQVGAAVLGARTAAGASQPAASSAAAVAAAVAKETARDPEKAAILEAARRAAAAQGR